MYVYIYYVWLEIDNPFYIMSDMSNGLANIFFPGKFQSNNNTRKIQEIQCNWNPKSVGDKII